MPTPQRNMSVDVSLHLNGFQNADNSFNVVATYIQGPTLPLSAQVVSPTGDIDLTKLNDTSNQYNPATDIQIWLANDSLLLDKAGNKLNFYYPNPRTGAITFSGPDTGTEFVNLADQGSNFGLSFTDLDSEVGQYGYCINVYAYPNGAPNGGWTIPLDPNIVNRPGTNR